MKKTVRAILKGSTNAKVSNSLLNKEGDLIVDTETHKVTFKSNGIVMNIKYINVMGDIDSLHPSMSFVTKNSIHDFEKLENIDKLFFVNN